MEAFYRKFREPMRYNINTAHRRAAQKRHPIHTLLILYPPRSLILIIRPSITPYRDLSLPRNHQNCPPPILSLCLLVHHRSVHLPVPFLVLVVSCHEYRRIRPLSLLRIEHTNTDKYRFPQSPPQGHQHRPHHHHLRLCRII